MLNPINNIYSYKRIGELIEEGSRVQCENEVEDLYEGNQIMWFALKDSYNFIKLPKMVQKVLQENLTAEQGKYFGILF